MSKWTAAATALLLVATGVVASQAASSPTYYACLKSGLMSSVGTKKPSCPKGATLINWGAQGPSGARGPAGQSAGLEIVSEDGKTTLKVLDFTNHLVMLPDGAIFKLYGNDQGFLASTRAVHTSEMVAHYLKPGCAGEPLYLDKEIFEDPEVFADPDSERDWWRAWENRATKQVFEIYGHMAPPGLAAGEFTIGKKYPSSLVKSTAVWDDGDDQFYCDEDDLPGKFNLMGLASYKVPEMGVWRFK